MPHPLVVNKYKENFDVWVGRPSRWGNPFYLRKGATDEERHECINKFRKYVNEHPELIEAAKIELRGKKLGCVCASKECHGDVWAEIANYGIISDNL